MTTFELSYFFKDPVSKCSHALRSWGLELQHVHSGRTQFSPYQPARVSQVMWELHPSPKTGSRQLLASWRVVQLWNPSPAGILPLAGFPGKQTLRHTWGHFWGRRKPWASPVQTINLINYTTKSLRQLTRWSEISNTKCMLSTKILISDVEWIISLIEYPEYPELYQFWFIFTHKSGHCYCWSRIYIVSDIKFHTLQSLILQLNSDKTVSYLELKPEKQWALEVGTKDTILIIS